jgi:nucleoside-diphosphate kinase
MTDPKEEKTLVLIKPDGVKRGLVGEVVTRIEKRGLKIIALEMIWANKDQVDGNYPDDDKWLNSVGEKTKATYEKYGYEVKKELGTDDNKKIGKMVREWLIDYMTSGPIIKTVVKGVHAVDMMRKMVGNTMPALAEMGTIRGDFSIDSSIAANKGKRAVHNIVHASGSIEEAEKEIAFWFAPEEIHDYKRAEEDIMF